MRHEYSRFGTCTSRVCLFLAIAVLALLPSVARAGRVGGITIDVDGKQYLSKSTFDNGSPPAAVVWRYLASTELEQAEGVTIPVQHADPLHATLRGKIVIDVRYGGKAEVAELRLVRRSPEAGWTVVSEDVEQIAASIGLRDIPVVLPDPATAKPVTPSGIPAVDRLNWIWIAVCGVVVALILAAVISRRNRNVGRA